jgi:hypothetical protein
VVFFHPRTSRRRAALAALGFASLFPLQAGASDQTTGDQAMSILAHASSGPLRCEIRKDETAAGVGLTGVVIGSRHVVGDFHFVATKSGGAGSSSIDQGDRFDLDPDKEQIVGRIEIALEPGAHVAVDLSVRSNDGFECRAMAHLGQ